MVRLDPSQVPSYLLVAQIPETPIPRRGRFHRKDLPDYDEDDDGDDTEEDGDWRNEADVVLVDGEVADEVAQSIADALQRMPSNSVVDKLIFSSKLTLNGIKILCEAFKSNKAEKLTSLRLSADDDLADELAMVLADMLKFNTTLTALDLSHNKFTPVGVKTIAGVIAGNAHITSLDLSWTKVGAEGAKPVCEAIATKGTALKKLSCGGNDIGDEGARWVAHVIKNNPEFSAVELYGNGIGDEGAKALGDAIRTSPSFKSLIISNTYSKDAKIGPEGAKALGTGLGESKTLKTLNLTDNALGVEGAKYVAQGLAKNASLTRLCLGGNDDVLGDEGAEAIGRAMMETRAPLRTLRLRECGIGAEGAKWIANGIASSKTLQTFYFYYNDVGEEGMKALAEGIAACPTIELWHMQSKSIGDAGAKWFGEAIKSSKSLKDVYSSNSAIGEEGAAEIGKALPFSKSIQKLHLEANSGIGDVGAEAIGEGLAMNTSLRVLDLSAAGIGARGASALAKGVAKCPTLWKLSLMNVKVEDQGAIAIAEALRESTSLERLELYKTGIKLEGAIAIAEAMEVTKSPLKCLDLDGNPIQEQGERRLARAYFVASAPITELSPHSSDEVFFSAMRSAFVADPSNVLARVKKNKPHHKFSSYRPPCFPLSFVAVVENWMRMLKGDSSSSSSLSVENIPEVPYAVAERGVEAVNAYFRAVGDEGLDKTSRLLVLMLGEGGAGKTSLLHTLTHPQLFGHLTTEGPSRATVGVEVKHLKLDEERSTIKFLDFGGQKDYYASQSVFFTDKCVTCVIFNSATYDLSRGAESFEELVWPSVAKVCATATTSPNILLVGTHLDEISSDDVVNDIQDDVYARFYARLQADFDAISEERKEFQTYDVGEKGDEGVRREVRERLAELERLALVEPRLIVKDVIVLSNQPMVNGTNGDQVGAFGVRTLFNMLATAASSHYAEGGLGYRLPVRYVRFLEALNEELNAHSDRPFVSISKAYSIANACGLKSDDAERHALELLHDLGEIMWFSNDPSLRNVVFLSLDFMTNAIKQIVRHDLVREWEGASPALTTYVSQMEKFASRKEEIVRRAREEGVISVEVVGECFPMWKELWTKDRSVFETMLGVTESLGLCTSVGEKKSLLFLPSLVGLAEGEITTTTTIYDDDDSFLNNDVSKIQIIRLWSFRVPPPGLMSSLAIKCNRIFTREFDVARSRRYFPPHTPRGSFRIRLKKSRLDNNNFSTRVVLGDDNDDDDDAVDVFMIASDAKIRMEIRTRLNSNNGDENEIWDVANRFVYAVEEILARFPSSYVRRYCVDPNNYVSWNTSSTMIPLEIVVNAEETSSKNDFQYQGRGFSPQSLLGPKESRVSSIRAWASFRPLPSGCHAHVFLCHHRDEAREACATFADDLTRHGLKAWLDTSRSHHGDSKIPNERRERELENMREGIRTSAMVSVFLTPRVFTRPYVRFELEVALKEGKPIVFVNVGPTVSPYPDRAEGELPNVNGSVVMRAMKRLLANEEMKPFEFQRSIKKANETIEREIVAFIFQRGGERLRERSEMVSEVFSESSSS